MNLKLWSRRKFLGVAVAVPAVAVVACESPEASGPGGQVGPPPGSVPDAGFDAGAPPIQDAGMMDEPDAGLMGEQDSGVPERHVCSEDFPRIDLKADCDAVGDGVTNDTKALQKAAAILQKAGGGELVIPPGVYIVGRQIEKTDPKQSGAWYKDEKMFDVSGLSCLKISGYGAILKIADGLHYGGFDPGSGDPGDYTSGTQNRAAVGRIINLNSCDNVLIEGLELDGNNEKLILGGQWGNVDRQAPATGLWMNMCQNVEVYDVHSHHHALDGVTVLYLSGAPKKKMPHKLVGVISEYNGRQGLSWIGGWGLECINCKFNHTGRAINNGKPMMSRPRAGLDIEPNAGTSQATREGLFTQCEFINNAGAGIVTAGADAGYSTFVDCTIWGTTSYSLWITKPGMKFSNCRIHGTATRASDGHTPTNASPDPELATSFVDCTFEDKPWTNGKVFRSAYLYDLNTGGQGVNWRRCTFINHQVRAVLTGDASQAELFDSCTFIHSNSGLSAGTYQSQFQGSRLRSCQFQESAQVSSGGRNYFISVSSVTVLKPDAGDPPTHVDGPKVRWSSAAMGPTGDIAPGTYP